MIPESARDKFDDAFELCNCISECLSRIPQLQTPNGRIRVDDVIRLIENDPSIQKIPVPNGGQLRNFISYCLTKSIRISAPTTMQP